ncbi:hypothetical protein GS831_18850 [Rhodococcus hoagii]|nr:hypothetical protein [Prescottella equi]
MTLVLRYAARSDRGLVRANNEDSVYAGARLLALADGMGGHAAGEVASQLMIAALAHLDDDEPGGDLLGKLEAATHEGNATIADHVEEDPELEGMGTTLTAILFAGSKLGLVHIGIRGRTCCATTSSPRSPATTRSCSPSSTRAASPPSRHTPPPIRRFAHHAGPHRQRDRADAHGARGPRGDRYLLCSDGLSDVVRRRDHRQHDARGHQ